MKFYSYLLILLISLNSFSQASKSVEDLMAELQKNTKQDTLKVISLLKLSTANAGANPEKMRHFAEDAKQLSEKINYKKGIGEAYKLQGASYFSTGDYNNAEKLFSKSLAIFEDIKNNPGIIICNSNLGSIKLVQNKYPEALKYYQTSIRFAEKTNSSKYAALAYGNMGIIYSELKNYDLALKHFNEALNIHKKSNYAAGIASSLSNIGNVYFNQKEYDNALDFFIQALNKNIENNDKLGMSREYGNIANVYSEQKKYPESYENHIKALKINEELKNKKGIAINNQGIGEYYLKQNKNSEALPYFKKTNQISKEIKVTDLEKQSYNSLSEVFEKLGNNDSAYYYFKKYIEVKESIDNEDKRKQISRLEIQYEFDTKEEKYKTQQLLDNEHIKQQNLLLELNNLKLNESNKERDLVRLNYLKTQSELKNESLEKRAQKKQLTIAEKEIQLNKITLENKERQKWYLISGLLLLGIIGSLLYFQNQNRKKNNKKLQLLNNELDQANKAKTRFFSILNHDLRGPIANLINFLQLQKESPELLDAESTERMHNKNMESAENLLNSMEDILQWSKSQMENFKPQPKTIYVNDLFEDANKHFSSFETINLQFVNPENIVLKTDENYLKTIVRNLTGNAIKALSSMPNPTIIWKAWQENGTSFLSISDNGKGADLEQFKALYDDKEVVGIKSGLGLHLIRDMANAIKCEIKVESEKDKGTTFTLTFDK
jgi:signal transduction histidine kinase